MVLLRGAVLTVLMMLVVTVQSQNNINGVGPGRSEGSSCTTVGNIVSHDRFCDKYYECIGTLGNTVWVGRPCAPGTIFQNGQFQVDDAKTCLKSTDSPSACTPNYCQNGGRCIQGVSSSSCICEAGFTGNQCQIDINECIPNPCLHGAACTDQTNDYNCDCPSSHTGKNCQTNIDDCDPNPCQYGGTCIDLNGDYHCECPVQHPGRNCEAAFTSCSLNCDNGGICSEVGGIETCACLSGFAGNRCQFDCANEKTCSSCTGSPECICQGTKYNTTNYTVLRPYIGVCNAFLWCRRLGNPGNYDISYYEMKCPAGTVWDESVPNQPTCNHFYQTKLDQCRRCSPNPCKNGGTCTDKETTKGGKTYFIGYVCDCAPGFTGFSCQTAVPSVLP